MLEKIKQLNEALLEVLLVDLLYLVIGEIIILIFFSDTLYMIGFLFGVVYAIFGSFQMSFKIRKVVYGMADARKTYLLGYFVRLAVMFAMFAALYILNLGNLVCALIGMFAMKVSAYLQPFTHRFLTKIKKGR